MYERSQFNKKISTSYLAQVKIMLGTLILYQMGMEVAVAVIEQGCHVHVRGSCVTVPRYVEVAVVEQAAVEVV